MREIRIYCFHRRVHDIPSMLKYLHLEEFDIASDFNFIWDEENPEYLVATELLYFSTAYMKKFKYLLAKRPITIFFAGEAVYPDLNMFDYAVAMNRKLIVSDRITRLPVNIFYEEGLHDKENTITEEQAKAMLHKDKKRFCSFIYSNSKAEPFRDELFHALSEYKRVESLGMHLNNVGTLIGGGSYAEGWQEFSVKIKSKYKFVIACENGYFEGYISEKLLTSLQAHTVPIYWGDKDIALEYNSEAFINCNDYDSLSAIVNRVKEIDENDDLWAHIVSQPWQTEAQKKASQNEYEQYKNFFTRIFNTPISEARRRPECPFCISYRNWFIDREMIGDKDFFSRLHRVMQDPNRLMIKLRNKTMKRTPFEEFFKD